VSIGSYRLYRPSVSFPSIDFAMETQRVALSLPSEARTHVAQAPPIKWGDLDLDDEIASADGAGVDITINYKNSSSHFADQRAASLQNDDATRGKVLARPRYHP
jgi:hypothetical protein